MKCLIPLLVAATAAFADTLPQYDHIVVMEENHPARTILGNTATGMVNTTGTLATPCDPPFTACTMISTCRPAGAGSSIPTGAAVLAAS